MHLILITSNSSIHKCTFPYPWRLPFNTHSDLLPGLCGVRSVEDELSYRALSFISSCLRSDSSVVNYVAQYGVYFGKLLSPIGRNVIHCSQLYSVNILPFLSHQSNLRNFKGWLSSRDMSGAYRVSFFIRISDVARQVIACAKF